MSASADQRAWPGQPLTETEVRVLRVTANGATPTEISRALGRSSRTYRRHQRTTEIKLGARTFHHAVALAVASGLTRPRTGEDWRTR